MAEEDDLALTQNDDEEQMSQTQSQTQSQSKKFYSLKFGARMEVIDVCPDTHGVLLVKMRWDVPLQSIVNQKVVIKYADVSTLLAKSIVCNQLEGLVFLELPNKAVSNQNRAFSTFLEDEIMDFYEAQSQDPSTQKKTFKEFTEITVEMIDDKYFLIAGEEDVFILNDGSTYSRKLNKQEIDDLDMNIVWNSKEKKEVFEASDKEAVNALVDVIATFNLLQVEKYYGFPLGSLVAHLRAYLYEPILKEQFTFYTTITLSGEQHGTGKSLMFAINQALLYGKQIPAEKHISDSKMFHRLAGLSEEGKVPVYVNEWDGNSNLFNSSVKGTWEASCWSVRGASFKPRTVLMANANATPDQIRFQAGVKSKVTFLYTGDARLKHDHKLEITRALVKRAKVAHVYLPSIIGLAIKTLMRPVSTEEVRGYDDELEDDEDERSAQALKDYDALFMELQDAITEYKLTVPPIFDKEPEHTVLTYFNESKGAEETPNEIDGRKKRAAKKLVKSLVETETLGAMSKRTYRDIEVLDSDTGSSTQFETSTSISIPNSTNLSMNTLQTSETLLSRKSTRDKRNKLQKQAEADRPYFDKLEEHSESSLDLVLDEIDGKGKGVRAGKVFNAGNFVAEYKGELLTLKEAKKKETAYQLDPTLGSYMFFFRHGEINYCLDATEDDGTFGRRLNHSRNNPNLVSKILTVNNQPRLFFVAKHNIHLGEELQWDYGDRSKISLQMFPWLGE